MNISDFQATDLGSLKQALSIAALRKSMNQDASTVTTLLKDMEAATAKTLEHSVTPHIGSNIDVKI